MFGCLNKKLYLCARFQVLRDLIPQNDQKRDKASFLLEVLRSTFNHLFLVYILMDNSFSCKLNQNYFFFQVIEYIQFLQDKLQIYEKSYEGWSQEPTKLIPWVKLYAML